MSFSTYLISCLAIIGGVILVAWISPRVRKELIRGWLTLSGIPTPDGDHPTGRRMTAFRSRFTGAVLTVAGVVAAYYFVWQPIQRATRLAGELHQGPFGLICPGVMVYCGLCQLVFDLRDEKSLRIGSDGRLKFTARARLVELGVLLAVATWCLGWYLYVRSLGFDIYLGDVPLPGRR
jgi:hypothetical protein